MSDPAIPCEGGTRKDSLSEALAIHGESQYFTLLREQKSNLWYIRSSKAICEDGFFISLKGYETQVFLDIYEVADDVSGNSNGWQKRWSRLNNDLNGRGVPDPEAEIKDIFLGELYYRFSELIKPEIITDMTELLDRENFIKKFEEPVKTFIKTASHFITGADGSYKEWIPPASNELIKTEKQETTDVSKKTAGKKASSKQTKSATPQSITPTGVTPNGIDEIWEEFKAFTVRLKNIKNIFKTLKISQSEADKRSVSLLYSVAVSYGALSLLSAIIGKETAGSLSVNLAFDHWDLGRKLAGIYRSFGASEAEAWRITDIVKVFLSRTKTKHFSEDWKEQSHSALAAAIIEKNYFSEDFRRILGVNLYNDIVWFNKEGFDDAVFYSTLLFMIDGSVDISNDQRINLAKGVYNVITTAKEKSECRFDYLLDFLR
jgi:hypothetical protein